MSLKNSFFTLFTLFVLGTEKSISQSMCFEFSNQAYTGGNQPRSIVSADFNNDDHLDLATANYENSTVSILIGNGNGDFNPPVNYIAGPGPNDILSADFNSDLNADLAIAVAGGVIVFAGNGDGTFADSAKYTAGLYHIEAIAIEDINNDSLYDILAADEFSLRIWTFIGNPDGTFMPGIATQTFSGPVNLSLADFNNDGWKDLIYCHFPPLGEIIHFFSVLSGDGSGTFYNETPIQSALIPWDAVGIDVNSDGYKDALIANFSNDSVSVYNGLGDFTFNDPVNYPAQIGPVAIYFRDMNHDGSGDIVVANYGGNGVSVFPGSGDGTYDPYVFTLCTVNNQSIAFGDFNEDGLDDMASSTTYFGSAYYAIILNCTTTEIENIPLEHSIKIYPNPVVLDILYCYLDNTTQEINYSVSTLQGTVIMEDFSTLENNRLSLKVNGLPAGMYFLHLTVEGQSGTLKFVKQ